MKNLYKKYSNAGFDENGVLNKFEITVPDNYNFAYDVIDEIAKNEPDRRAMVWVGADGEERVFTYSDLMKKSNQTANMLTASGIKKGDKVMAVLKRHYTFWFLTLAMSKIGAVLIPATNQLKKKDYLYRFDAAGIRHIAAVSEEAVISQINESAAEYGGIDQKFIIGGNSAGWLNFEDEIEKYPDTFDRIPNDVNDNMLIYFTSGTTGYPKMVTHTHYYSAAHIITAKYWHNINDQSLHLTVAETGWAKAMWGKMYGQFLCAASVFVYDMNRFDPADLLEKISKYKVTSFCAPPTMYRMFIQEDLSKYDFSALKSCTIAGEALNPEVYNKWLENTGLKLMEAFGQTEGVVMLANLAGMEPKPGSMGKPIPLYNADIVDDNGNPLPDGETGEIVLRTDGRFHKGMFKGYYRNDEATDAAWHDNMYHTGDTAYKDEDGYYWYVGRKDDLIKSSGYRIGPFEIESVLIEHESVLEAAVTGVSDPVRGQVVKATVVLTKDYKNKGGDELKKELQEYVKKQTAPYKYPRIIEFVEELPKTISGKIRRVEIREHDGN